MNSGTKYTRWTCLVKNIIKHIISYKSQYNWKKTFCKEAMTRLIVKGIFPSGIIVHVFKSLSYASRLILRSATHFQRHVRFNIKRTLWKPAYADLCHFMKNCLKWLPEAKSRKHCINSNNMLVSLNITKTSNGVDKTLVNLRYKLC